MGKILEKKNEKSKYDETYSSTSFNRIYDPSILMIFMMFENFNIPTVREVVIRIGMESIGSSSSWMKMGGGKVSVSSHSKSVFS